MGGEGESTKKCPDPYDNWNPKGYTSASGFGPEGPE